MGEGFDSEVCLPAPTVNRSVSFESVYSMVCWLENGYIITSIRPCQFSQGDIQGDIQGNVKVQGMGVFFLDYAPHSLDEWAFQNGLYRWSP